MFKHVIVERVPPDHRDEFFAIGLELWDLLAARGWRTYRAWTPSEGDEGEPPLFDVGILVRATPPEPDVMVFEAEFDDRESLETQLEAMRSDPEVVRLLVRALELTGKATGRSHIFEQWGPPAETG